MTKRTSTPEMSDGPELTDSPVDQATRRNFLTLLIADDDALQSLTESMGRDELHRVDGQG